MGIIVLFIFLVGLCWLASLYIEYDVPPTLWSILGLALPFVNLIIAVYIDCNCKTFKQIIIKDFVDFKLKLKTARNQNKNKHEI